MKKAVSLMWICRGKKEEIDIELENGCLTISAAKGWDKDEQDRKSKYIRRELYAERLLCRRCGPQGGY